MPCRRSCAARPITSPARFLPQAAPWCAVSFPAHLGATERFVHGLRLCCHFHGTRPKSWRPVGTRCSSTWRSSPGRASCCCSGVPVLTQTPELLKAIDRIICDRGLHTGRIWSPFPIFRVPFMVAAIACANPDWPGSTLHHPRCTMTCSPALPWLVRPGSLA